MTRYFLAFLGALVLLSGAGCVKQGQTKAMGPMPTLEIKSPGLTVTTTADKIEISGKSNMPQVRIGNSTVQTESGMFKKEVPLEVGPNYFQVTAGNGFTTTSKTINIQKGTNL